MVARVFVVMEAWKAAKNALECVLEAVPGESIAIVCDDEKRDVGRAFAKGAITLRLWTRLMVLKTTEEARTEIPPQLLEFLTQRKPDIYLNLLRGIREETPFRINTTQVQMRDCKSRIGHCPWITLEMLTQGALALTPEEHMDMQSFANKLIRALDQTIRVEMSNPAGTNLSLNVEGREFFTETRINWKTRWVNLPTGEVLVAPVENSMQGRLVCDMAIGGIGLIKIPVEITAKNGRAEKLASKENETLEKLRDTLNTDEWSNTVGEFAFGINSKARFVDEVIEAEKILGTIHIAFGNNTDFLGGKNISKNHIDLLISKPTVKITKYDGSKIVILEKGHFKL